MVSPTSGQVDLSEPYPPKWPLHCLDCEPQSFGRICEGERLGEGGGCGANAYESEVEYLNKNWILDPNLMHCGVLPVLATCHHQIVLVPKFVDYLIFLSTNVSSTVGLTLEEEGIGAHL